MLAETEKFTHQQCNYRPGGGQACGNCSHFEGQSCQIVQAPITAEMVCDFYAQAAQGQEQPAPDEQRMQVAQAMQGMPRGG